MSPQLEFQYSLGRHRDCNFPFTPTALSQCRCSVACHPHARAPALARPPLGFRFRLFRVINHKEGTEERKNGGTLNHFSADGAEANCNGDDERADSERRKINFREGERETAMPAPCQTSLILSLSLSLSACEKNGALWRQNFVTYSPKYGQ